MHLSETLKLLLDACYIRCAADDGTLRMDRIKLLTTTDNERWAQLWLEPHSQRLPHLPDAGQNGRLVPAQRTEALA